MREITLTINGKQVKGKEGDTVLQVCQANGIDVPTLCHMEGLSDVGACRLCVVDIERERKPVPSCTYPARDGLVVKTDTPQLEKYRRLILELIFTERNHFCMFCAESGDCELQKLAYRYQMDHVRYPYNFPSLPTDALSDNLILDHNRCVLCGRCIRTCGEVAGIHAIDFGKRGWKTMVTADLEQPLAESICVSCGACLQACPTGAILSKQSMYKGKASECQSVKTICPVCGVGCEITALVKDNNLIKIQSPSLTGPRASLCKEGRFGLLDGGRARITNAMVRNPRGKMVETTLDRAIEVAAERLGAIRKEVTGIASTRYPVETLAVFQKFVREAVGTDYVDTTDGSDYRVIAKGARQFSGSVNALEIECPIEEIPEADCILVVGADPLRTHPVVGSLIRRAMGEKKAKVIVIDTSRDAFPLWSEMWLRPAEGSEETLLNGIARVLVDKGLVKKEHSPVGLARPLSRIMIAEVAKETGIGVANIELAATMYGGANKAVIIYGQGVLRQGNPGMVASILSLADLTGNRSRDRLRVISLKPNANSRGAWEVGLASQAPPREKVKGAYVLLGDEPVGEDLVDWLEPLDLLVVQAEYESPLTALADVVFPASTWTQREAGRYVSLDGRSNRSQAVIQPAKGMLPETKLLARLARKLGYEKRLS